MTTTRKRYGRLIDERNKSKNENKEKSITDEATVSNHIQRIRKALDSIVQQVEGEEGDTTTTKGEGEGSSIKK
jgi:hypothetical protein